MHVANKNNNTYIAIWSIVLALIALTWALMFSLTKENKMQEEKIVQNNIFNIARISQEHAVRTFRSADQTIRFIEENYFRTGDLIDIEKLVKDGVIDVEIFPQVGIINEYGIYIKSNLPITGTLDLSDREHFKVHVASNSGELFISKPVLGRATGAWSIQLTRRISRNDGTFAGVVVVSISLEYFKNFYRDLKLGSDDLIAMYGLDQVARIRSIGDSFQFGSNANQAQMFGYIRQGQLDGFYSSASVVDAIDRLIYFRKVPNYPLVIVLGIKHDDIKAKYSRFTLSLWIGCSIMTALFIALAIAITRYILQLRSIIENRLESQKNIKEKNDLLSAIFDLSSDGFVSFNIDRCINYISPMFSQLTGYNNANLMGVHENLFSEMMSSLCVNSQIFPSMANIQSLKINNNKTTIELNNPVRRILEINLRVSTSEFTSKVLFIHDVTHKTEVEQMKTEFLSTAAHELRTPMASILGFSEILQTAEFNCNETSEFLKIIYSESQLMANVLDDLLDLARIEERRGKDFYYQRINLCDLLPVWVNNYQLLEHQEKPELMLPSGPIFLMADPKKLCQALSNILSNAYKFSPNGNKIYIKVAKVQSSKHSLDISIEVTDSGIGMTIDQLRRVCERFYRADTSGKKLGSGLGMSITQEIIMLHHGKLNFESRLGHGTSVYVHLPTLM